MPDDVRKQQLMKELLSLMTEEQQNGTAPEPPVEDILDTEELRGHVDETWLPEPDERSQKVRKNFYLDQDVAAGIETLADRLPRTSMSKIVNHVMRKYLENRGVL